jgi:hypothetical protein
VLISDPAEFAVAIPKSAVAGALIERAPPEISRVSAVPAALAGLDIVKRGIAREVIDISVPKVRLDNFVLDSY